MEPTAAPTSPVVIRISPMAHFGVAFLVLGLLSVVLTNPAWLAVLFVIPVLLSAVVIRYRTTADAQELTVRTALRTRHIGWDDVDGLRFGRGAWALARLTDGSEVRLPAVTFGTLPLLSAASGGRVPNPYDTLGDDDRSPETDT